MKHIQLGKQIDVKIHRKGRSGDYIAYPRRYSPSEHEPEDGVHLDHGTEGDIVRVEVRSRQKGFIEAEPVGPVEPDGLHAIWNDHCGDYTETLPQQQPRGPRDASDADPTKRHREFMREVSMRFR